jgi:hypothetical protein
MPVHAQKNQSLTDLLQAKPKTVQGRKFYHTRTVLPDILELRMQNGRLREECRLVLSLQPPINTDVEV